MKRGFMEGGSVLASDSGSAFSADTCPLALFLQLVVTLKRGACECMLLHLPLDACIHILSF